MTVIKLPLPDALFVEVNIDNLMLLQKDIHIDTRIFMVMPKILPEGQHNGLRHFYRALRSVGFQEVKEANVPTGSETPQFCGLAFIVPESIDTGTKKDTFSAFLKPPPTEFVRSLSKLVGSKYRVSKEGDRV